MTTFIIRRLLQGFVVLALSTVMIYFLLTLIPGGPFSDLRRNPTGRISTANINRLGYLMGINDPKGVPYPWYERYFRWLFTPDKSDSNLDVTIGSVHIRGGGVLTGDLGRSLTVHSGVPVAELVKQRLPYTLILAGASLFFSLIIAVPIGIISAVRQYSRLDYIITLFTFFGISMPVFWLGWMMIFVFGVQFKLWHDQVPWLSWLPYLPTSNAYDGGLENDVGNRLLHLIMPVFILSLIQIAGWSRFLRSSVLEVLRLDYVRTAWAKGLTQRVVILKHALRNALIPLITLLGLSLPFLVSGAIVTETVFAYPGVGRLFLDAIGAYDWPVVMAYLLLGTIAIIMGNLLADVFYAIVDPRIRVS